MYNIRSKEVNWTTLYIKGRSDFRHDVLRKLSHSELNFMPGYTGNSINILHDMYWVDDQIAIRTVKEVIGGKLVWKYRLRFYTSLESFIESNNTIDSTADTDAMLEPTNLLQRIF